MGLETGDFIDDLVITNPIGASDPKSQGDDHIRFTKKVVKQTFPNVDGAVTFTAAQFNDLVQAAANATIAGVWNFTTNPKIDGVDLLTGAIPVSGTWVFTGNPTTEGNEIGFREIVQNIQTIDYTLVLSDNGKHILQTGATKTITIPANASVAYPIGASIEFICTNATGMSIAITTDTMTLADSTTTGTRTLAQNGLAVATKLTATTWIISGAGLT